MYIQSGVGNLGTESVFDVHRVAAEMMGVPWENVVLAWGDTSQNLPWTCVSGGSQTTHAMTPRGARGGVGRHRQGQGDRREDARRKPRVVSGRRRAASRAADAA